MSVPLHHAMAVSGLLPDRSTPVVGKSDVRTPFTMAGAAGSSASRRAPRSTGVTTAPPRTPTSSTASLRRTLAPLRRPAAHRRSAPDAAHPTTARDGGERYSSSASITRSTNAPPAHEPRGIRRYQSSSADFAAWMRRCAPRTGRSSPAAETPRFITPSSPNMTPKPTGVAAREFPDGARRLRSWGGTLHERGRYAVARAGLAGARDPECARLRRDGRAPDRGGRRGTRRREHPAASGGPDARARPPRARGRRARAPPGRRREAEGGGQDASPRPRAPRARRGGARRSRATSRRARPARGGLARRRRVAARPAPPPRALCPPARRTRETFEALRAGPHPAPRVALDRGLYSATAEQLLERLGVEEDEPRVLLVGHNPAIGELASALAGHGEAEPLAPVT